MKVLWGYVPFQQKTPAIQEMAKLIRQFGSMTKDVHIGCVVTGNESYFNTAFDIPISKRFTVYPQKFLIDELKRAKVNLEESRIHVVPFHTLSTTRSVDRFLDLAKSHNIKLLALFTGGKSALGRFFIGSFTETAVHRSHLNLLIVNPKTKIPVNVKNVFFASDYSESSKRDVLQLLKICKSLKAKLTVFHAADSIYKWANDESSPEVITYRKNIDQMTEWIKRSGKAARVSCEVIVKSEFKPIFEQSINRSKKAKADLIVVSAEAGPTAALMGGSVTRQILRNSTRPVLVIKRQKGNRE